VKRFGTETEKMNDLIFLNLGVRLPPLTLFSASIPHPVQGVSPAALNTLAANRPPGFSARIHQDLFALINLVGKVRSWLCADWPWLQREILQPLTKVKVERLWTLLQVIATQKRRDVEEGA